MGANGTHGLGVVVVCLLSAPSRGNRRVLHVSGQGLIANLAIAFNRLVFIEMIELFVLEYIVIILYETES